MAKQPAKKSAVLGPKGKKTTSAAAKKAAAALKSVTAPKPAAKKTRKKPGPKPGTKRSAVTAAGKPRKKPGPKPGSKRGALTAAGKPRKKPGPKPTSKKTTIKKKTTTVAKTRVIKKAVAKKSIPKKSKAKKVAAKKTVTKKTPAKKTAIKPVTVKKAPPVKATKAKVQKAPAPKRNVATKKPAPAPKQTLAKQIATLRTRIDSIQARLKRSDAQTRKNIRTLEKAFSTLQAKVGNGSPEFSEKVSLLSGKIENITASAHADIGLALNEALNDPSRDNLTAVLTRAEQRLVAAETAQSASIAKVNRHIADMALAIDARFKKEARVNAQAISHLDDRIITVEAESAAAISNLGEKVVAISSEFSQRAEDSDTIIKEKISEIALKTQEEFEQYRANLERRIETLASQQDQARANADTVLSGLSSRVEGLEHVASSAAMTALSNANPPAYPSVVTPDVTPSAIVEDHDAFAAETLQDTSAQIVPPNPYAVPEPAPVVNEAEAHIPQEFDPEAFIQGSTDGHQIPAPSPQHAPTPMAAPAIATSALMTDDLTTPNMASASYETPIPDPAFIPEVSLPYADPAYAESSVPYEEAMSQARPGDFGTEKNRLALPKLDINITPRNMKVAGIALGVAAVGLIGVKTLGGKSNPNTIMAETSIDRNLDSVTAPINNAPIIIETTAPTIGDYADNKVDVAPMGSAEAVTLEAAAQAGDPVAQYQMGISYLDNGRTEDAVRLIRSASDSGQPAAQYRLAKLYETGEGVTQNAGMARQLTERAARSGNRIAMHDLALYHAEGRGGVKMDLDTAAKWFEKAAERGVVDSQFNLGVMYETGKGVPKNLADAFVWYSIAAAQGDQFAKERVGVLETQLDTALISTAKTRASTFTPSKIDQAANGIFKNLPWNTQKGAARMAADPRVKDVQVMLIGLGFDTGGADGAIGPKTRTAIVSFQKANGLPETGQVDDILVDRLEFASGA